MSKTDKTRPWWTKREHLVEVHQHEDGTCDIAGQAPAADNTGWRRGRCYFTGRWYEHTFWCGCSLCGIPKSERRKSRYAGRSLERNWWRDV